MCNDYEQRVSYAQYAEAIRRLELSAPDSESAEDLPVADDIRIGDIGAAIRTAGNGVELKPMRFGWPPPRPRAGPVFNFKSEKRDFSGSRRCVIVMSGFFEFTGSKYPKAKHRFSLRDSPIMGIAGLWSEDRDGALSFVMLTTEPGPDIAPYHDRQVCVLRPEDWAAWLFLTRPQEDLLRPLPARSLVVETVRAERK
ncbi:MAG TPA: SOS response-associated peptidase [Devosia sp.]|nr:SOS response-associated peptidase [Devosia sp.]